MCQCGGALIGALDTAADKIEKYGTVRAGKINAYKKDSENINGGYPVLAWQEGSSVEPVTVTLGDVNGDGDITMSDTYLMFRYVKGSITAFPAEKE